MALRSLRSLQYLRRPAGLRWARFATASSSPSSELSSIQLAHAPDDALTPEIMQTVLQRLGHLHGGDGEIRIDCEANQLFRVLMRYNTWVAASQPEGPLTFPAPHGFSGRIFPLMSSEGGESFQTLAKYNPGITPRKIQGRAFFSPGMLFHKAKEGGNAASNTVGVTLDPTEKGQLMYDEGLYPALQEVRIAVHLEDTIRNLTVSSQGAETLGEEETKALGEISQDDVYCARGDDDSFIAAFTEGEPGGLEKSNVRELFRAASESGSTVRWRYITLPNGAACTWSSDFVKMAAAVSPSAQ